jgi:hypothetical protein
MSANQGASFFSGGSGECLSWEQWIRSADEVLSIENDTDSACHWASATFELFLAVFSKSNCITNDSALFSNDTQHADARMGE